MQKQRTTLSDRLWVQALGFAILYALTAWISREISFPLASFPTIWLPSGLLIAILLFNKPYTWPVFLGAALPIQLLYDVSSGESAIHSLVFFLSNALEAAVAAWALTRSAEKPIPFYTPRNLIDIFGYGVMASALSATINTTFYATVSSWADFWSTWRIAWISHGLGILVITPLILSWTEVKPRVFFHVSAERLIELSILMLGAIVCSLYVFVGEFGLNRQSYLVVPFLIWAALRFGTRGATLLGFIVTLFSAWGTTRQLATFAYSDATIALNMDSLGSFLGITLLTCYMLANTWSKSKNIEQALRESEERYRLLIENQGEGIGFINKAGVFTFANPAAAQIMGVLTGKLDGQSIIAFTGVQRYNQLREQAELTRKGEKTTHEVEITQPGGKRRNLLVTVTPQYNAEGVFSGTFAIFLDITERKQAEMALRDSRARFQTLFDHSPIPIWEEDFSRIKRLIDGIRKEYAKENLNGNELNWREIFSNHPEHVEACEGLLRILDVNQATLELFHFTNKAEFMAQVHQMLRRGPRDVLIEELVAIAEGKTSFELEGPNDLVDGIIRYHYVRWTVAPGYEEDYRRVVVSIIDVTERRAAEEQMRYLSTHDVLTGLYNRNFFEAELERLQNSRLEPMNVMVVDVNGMKVTNDTLGHAAGDDLLRRTAQVLKLSFRKEDIIARIGGDEFVVLFHGPVSIPNTVTRVRECLKEHNHWYEGQPLSLAIGAVTSKKGQSLVELLKKADQLMYKEKLHSRKAKVVENDDKSEVTPGNPPKAV